MKQYVVVIERAKSNFAVYVPDLPGCVAAAKTRAGVLRSIRAAIDMHITGLREDGLPVPSPTAQTEYIPAPLPISRAVRVARVIVLSGGTLAG